MATGGKTIESKELPFDYLSKITNDFSDDRKLGVSQFGTLYKGIEEDGNVIAVKKLHTNSQFQPDKRFRNEVNEIMALKHENLVMLVGSCRQEGIYVPEIKADVSECLLCYEYFLNGNLDDYLFGNQDFSPAEAGTSRATEDFSLARSIDWDTCFEIITGICNGLLFLHSLQNPIIHMDLKLGNIWLDEKMVPKIGNFGLSRLLGNDRTRMVTENVVGSYGHMAPEYLYRGEISTKADIYSLGLLIIEITTRKKNYQNKEQPAARQYITEIRTEWTAERIASKYSSLDAERLHQIHSCIKIGLECVEIDRKNRPPIEKVVEKLSAI